MDHAAALIAENVATARELSERLYPEDIHAPTLEEEYLLRLARRVYARMAVWYGDDAAVLADEAQDHFEEAHNDSEPVEVEETQDAHAKRGRVEPMSYLLEHIGAPPKLQDHKQVRFRSVDILACLMHAAEVIHGEPYLIYDAHEPFVID